MAIYVGNSTVTTANFTDSTGAASDPSENVTLEYAFQGQSPTTVSGAQLTHVSTGQYAYSIALSSPGALSIKWTGTWAAGADEGAVPAAVGVSGLIVEATPF